MTREETLKILSVIKAAYRESFQNMTPQEGEQQVNVWLSAFRDRPYELVNAAVGKYINDNQTRFAPVIGQINACIVKLTQPEPMTAQEAWNLIEKALRNSLYHAREEFEKLPEVLQQVVGSPAQLASWAETSSETVHSVIASNFQRSYKDKVTHLQELVMLPPELKKLLGGKLGNEGERDRLLGGF